jgi:hypothetical protein
MFPRKRPVEGAFVVVSEARIRGRGLDLIEPRTRCVSQYDVHELIVTADSAGPGGMVADVAYWGFFEVLRSGVLQVGDDVLVNGERVACLAGFDLSHAPNHLNIVLRAEAPQTGMEQGFQLGDRVTFQLPPTAAGAARPSPPAPAG